MQETKAECWARLIAEQEAGRESVRAFCRRRGVGEHSFYWWRRRRRENYGVRFAVVEARPAPVSAAVEPILELVLNNGERLRMGRGIEAAILRLALDVVRT